MKTTTVEFEIPVSIPGREPQTGAGWDALEDHVKDIIATRMPTAYEHDAQCVISSRFDVGTIRHVNAAVIRGNGTPRGWETLALTIRDEALAAGLKAGAPQLMVETVSDDDEC